MFLMNILVSCTKRKVLDVHVGCVGENSKIHKVLSIVCFHWSLLMRQNIPCQKNVSIPKKYSTNNLQKHF